MTIKQFDIKIESIDDVITTYERLSNDLLADNCTVARMQCNVKVTNGDYDFMQYDVELYDASLFSSFDDILIAYLNIGEAYIELSVIVTYNK